MEKRRQRTESINSVKESLAKRRESLVSLKDTIVRRLSRRETAKDSSSTAHDVLVVQLKLRLKDFDWEGEEGGELTKLSHHFYLFQWLKQTNFNVDKAEAALRKSFTWRKKNEICTLTNKNFPEDAAQKFPVYMDAVSRGGTPVGSWGGVPAWDIRGFVEGGPDGDEKFIRYCALMTLAAENMWLKHNERLNKIFSDPPDNLTYICTPKGLSPSQLASSRTVRSGIQVLKDIATMFPPMIEQLIYVDVPRTFSIILKVIKPFLSFIRMEFYDRDEKKWKKSLAEFIDLDQLRPQFGGTKVSK